MEDPELRRHKIKQERLKSRVVGGQETCTVSTGEGGDTAEEVDGTPPPIKKRKVKKKAAFFEDIIDGFAIRAFKTYEDLTRVVELETGQRDGENCKSEQGTNPGTPGCGARITGSGGSGSESNKVGPNDSPGKESVGKSTKTKKKKHSTTNQENDSSVIQADVSRCSDQSESQLSGNVSTATPPAGGTINVSSLVESSGISALQHHHPPVSSRTHSFASQQEQTFSSQCPPGVVSSVVDNVVTALKPHSQQLPQQPKPRKIQIVREKEVHKTTPDEHYGVFDPPHKDAASKDVSSHVDIRQLNHHQNTSSTHRIKLSSDPRNSDVYQPIGGENTGNNLRQCGAAASSGSSSAAATSNEYQLFGQAKVPQVSRAGSPGSATSVATPYGQQKSQNSDQTPSSQSSQKLPPPRTVSVVSSKSQNAIITSDPFGNSIIIKREVPDWKQYSNDPPNPVRRPQEVNGHSHSKSLPYPYSQETAFIEGGLPNKSIKAPFTPNSQSSPQPVASPVQEQVVAPVSNPKDKFGHGRIGSQTLFTPYATTAVTRVRSPIGGGGPPTVSSASHSSGSPGTDAEALSSDPHNGLSSSYTSSSNLYHPHHSLHQLERFHAKPSQGHHNHPHHQGHLKSSHSRPPNHPHPQFHHQFDKNGNTSRSEKISHHSGHQRGQSDEGKSSETGHNIYRINLGVNSTSANVPVSSSASKHYHQQQKQRSVAETPVSSTLGLPGSSGANPKVISEKPPKDKIVSSESGSSCKATTAFGSIARLLDTPLRSDQPKSSLHSIGHLTSQPGESAERSNNQSYSRHTSSRPIVNIHKSSTNSQHNSQTGSDDQKSFGGVHSRSRVTGSYSGHFNANVSCGTSVPSVSNQVSSIGQNSSGVQQGSIISNVSASAQSCSSRSHSPRGHSPNRERDSYSSNVSSLSRSSATPVSGPQSSHLSLPPNLSPQLQSSSYSKAASWLSTVPGLSPVPRLTPSSTPSSIASQLSGPTPSNLGHLSLPPSSVAGGFVGYPGVPVPHGLPSSHSSAHANMFAPPILPLSSISTHSVPQPPSFAPGADSLFPGQSNSDIVRRDLESRLISGDRNVAPGASHFLSRPTDLHPHHSLLPHLGGVGHLPPHPPGAPPPASPSHPSLFPPTLFKDLPKLGIDSPFYRTNVGMSYPGFNGMLAPPSFTTPFAPPTQITGYTQRKTGKWNAMHVRISWEIYQHQQKGVNPEGKPGGSSSSTSASTSKLVAPSSASSGGTGISTPPTSVGPSLSSDFLRSSSSQFPGLGRSGDVTPYSTPILSPHAPPSHSSPRGPPFDPLFVNPPTSHLGPPLTRYPGFAALGPSFGGLSGLGAGFLGRDIPSFVALSPGQEQWARFPVRHAFPGTNPSLAGWPMQQQRTELGSKTPTEFGSSRRQKDSEPERPSRHSESRDGRGRDSSPFRDRSPIRAVRTPLENGDGDSRSSRSNDSQNNSVTTSQSSSHSKPSSRLKEDPSSNGDREKTPTSIASIYDRERGSVSDKSLANFTSSHQSRIYSGSSPLSTAVSAASAWEAFPNFLGTNPRMSLTLLDRDHLRMPPNSALRASLYPNSPYGALPLGVMPPSHLSATVSPGGNPLGSLVSANSSKTSPALSGASPLLSVGGAIPPSPVSLSHSHNHIHSSQQLNGPNSPMTGSSKPPQSRASSGEEKHGPGVQPKEEPQ